MAGGFMRAGAVAVALLACGAPASAELKSCSCENLQSLQEELENALYQAKFFNEMAWRLKEKEDYLIAIKSDQTHPDSNLDVPGTSLQLRAEIMRDFQLPHDPAKGYTGPPSVTMRYGQCEQPQAQLDAMRNGSQCSEIGDIMLAHEAQHREICKEMGAEIYWKRLPSFMTFEEVDLYTEQAKQIRKQLKRVIDEGTITVEAKMEPRLTGNGMDVTYSHVTAPTELTGKSTPGSDDWSLEGKGTEVTKIKNIRIGGMSCVASGQLNNALDLNLKTDGLSMDMDASFASRPGDVKITCKGGFGMSMRPPGETGTTNFFADKRVTLETNSERAVREMAYGKMQLPAGISLSGTHTVKVTLVCPGK